jgi:hypothetical protein
VSILTGGGVLINRPMAWAIFSCDQASISIIIIIVAVLVAVSMFLVAVSMFLHACVFICHCRVVNCSAIASSNKFRGCQLSQTQKIPAIKTNGRPVALDSSDVQTVMLNAYYCHSRM